MNDWALMFVMVAAIIAAVLLLIPTKTWLRRMMGYQTIIDLVMSSYMINVYAATGAVSGLSIAIFAALGFSLTLRAVKFFIGYEVLAVNGEESMRLVAAELLTQGARWARATFMALFRGGRINAPAELNVQWVQHDAPMYDWISSIRLKVRNAWEGYTNVEA